ncbi:Cu2+-exporting ATPase [Neorhizobium sp. R1-B]|nr:Cu2+-exporting ATPase [Neorhizobium sp. R1-B]
MSCCVPIDTSISPHTQGPGARDEAWAASRDAGGGSREIVLSVPDMGCAACIAKIEKALRALPGVEAARVNLTERRAVVRWRGEREGMPDFVEELSAIGYSSHLASWEDDRSDGRLSELVRALAVAGFSAMNIMVLSVSVWSGADPGTRQAFHLLSAALALPVIIYSGRIFYRSAWSAVIRGRTNMDLPISVGVLLSFALSLYDTFNAEEAVYFEESTSLIFFLLAGRALDHLMSRARSAVEVLAKRAPRRAFVLLPDGSSEYVPLSEIEPGMQMIVAAGDRVPVDGTVISGTSAIDYSLLSGESCWLDVAAGAQLRSGVINLQNPLVVEATATSHTSFLSVISRMMEAAEGGRAGYRRQADRAARLYVPVVHGLALLSLLGWLYFGGDLHRSISVAVAVLIITCPCGLGLAVPIVQVMAARRLFERGIIVRDGSALERLKEVDVIVFDKTGTLTIGEPRIVNAAEIASDYLAIAKDMARHSRHPASVAIARVPGVAAIQHLGAIEEVHGFGLEARAGENVYRLGRPRWAVASDEVQGSSGTVLARYGELLADFFLKTRYVQTQRK